MGWTKRQEALDYLRSLLAYYYVRAGDELTRGDYERGAELTRKYLDIAEMLSIAPDPLLLQIQREPECYSHQKFNETWERLPLYSMERIF